MYQMDDLWRPVYYIYSISRTQLLKIYITFFFQSSPWEVKVRGKQVMMSLYVYKDWRFRYLETIVTTELHKSFSVCNLWFLSRMWRFRLFYIGSLPVFFLCNIQEWTNRAAAFASVELRNIGLRIYSKVAKCSVFYKPIVKQHSVAVFFNWRSVV